MIQKEGDVKGKNEQTNVTVIEKLRSHSVGEIEEGLKEVSRWKVLNPEETKRIQLQSFFDLGLCEVMATCEAFISECVPLPEKGRENPLLVVPARIVSVPTQVALIGKRFYRKGGLYPYQIEESIVNLVETPHTFYWLYDVRFLEVKRDIYVWERDCMAELAKNKKRGVTIEEALAYLVQNPETIKGLYSSFLSVLGSRMGGRVVSLEYDRVVMGGLCIRPNDRNGVVYGGERLLCVYHEEKK